MKDKQPYKQGPITELTPKLMEGYVKGTLSPRMSQKVKEFLDENPFEAEAIEGLKSQSVDLQGELQDLEGRLSRKLTIKDNFRYIWPVAAAISLLLMSGLIFYLLTPDPYDKVALSQEATEVKPKEQLKTVLEIDPETPFTDNVAPAPVSEIKKDTEIIEVADEEEIEEQIEINSNIETAAPVANNLAGAIQPNKQEISIEPKLQIGPSKALSNENIIEEQVSTIQENVTVDDSHRRPEPLATARSKAKKAYTPAVIEPTARNYTRSAELPMAEPPEEISDYLKKHTNYPKTAEENGVRGSVAVTFTVNENGGLEDFEIVEKLGFGCDEEAIRTLREGPSWKPAEINGIPIRSRGHIEVEFPPQK